jgi:hypothetical protein
MLPDRAQWETKSGGQKVLMECYGVRAGCGAAVVVCVTGGYEFAPRAARAHTPFDVEEEHRQQYQREAQEVR